MSKYYLGLNPDYSITLLNLDISPAHCRCSFRVEHNNSGEITACGTATFRNFSCEFHSARYGGMNFQQKGIYIKEFAQFIYEELKKQNCIKDCAFLCSDYARDYTTYLQNAKEKQIAKIEAQYKSNLLDLPTEYTHE